jgi:perosamine synthetase
MAVKFSVPLESAANFPPPTILASPKFRPGFLTFKNQLDVDTEHCIFTKNGRGAIAIAGEALKREGKNIILIPAYHCPALVEPFIWLNYEVRFFPINPDLSVDIDYLKSLLEGGEITHCVLIRYFGFAQNVDEVEVMLRQHNISIIEDCAHAFFAFQHNILEKGCASDAQICSINKLLPSIDGGVLYMPKQSLPALKPRGWVSEIKGILHTLGISQRLLKLKKASPIPTPAQPIEFDAKAFRYFVPAEEYVASYRHTSWLAKYSSLNKIKKLRRDNFTYLVSKLEGCAAGSPLYTKLKTQEVPYVLPFLLNDVSYFKALRMKGIQVLRWEEIAQSSCKTSANYRERLVQLPCHHQMSESEMDTLIESIIELG